MPRYWGDSQNLAVSKFLPGLSLTLRSQVQGQILGDSILTLTATFSKVMRVSTRANVFSAPSIEQSAIVFGRGRDRDFGGRGCWFVGGGRGSYGAVPLRKNPDNADTVNAVITSPRSVRRNLINLSRHSFLSLLHVTLLKTIRPLLHYSWIFHGYTDTRGVWSTSTVRVLSEQSFSNSCISFRYARL